MYRLELPNKQIEEQFRRAVFNVIARNQDDHVKNIAFLMNREGGWSLSPAFDIAYSYNPSGAWTSQHQMSINGKRDDLDISDLVALANVGGIKNRRARDIIEQVTTAVGAWKKYAEEAGVSKSQGNKIAKTFRLSLLR